MKCEDLFLVLMVIAPCLIILACKKINDIKEKKNK